MNATLTRYGTLLVIILAAAWFGQHPSYEPVIVLLTALGGFITPDLVRLFARRKPTREAIPIGELKRIGEVRFDYLPEKPTDHGWTLGLESEEKREPLYSRANEAPYPGCIQIQSRSRYYLDYSVEPAERLTDVVRLSLRMTSASLSALYFRLSVQTGDHSKKKKVWINHKVGKGKPWKFDDAEWGVLVDGEPHEHGWITVQFQLQEEVATTFGTEGWILDGLIGFRLRDSVSLSPIEMFRHVPGARA
jgi:hypothetical protein